MMPQRMFLILCIALLAIPSAIAKTYKTSYPMTCSAIWPAVKATLANQDNYAQVILDEAKMSADYQPKHSVHVDVSGVLLQRMNHVRLVPQDSGCEMQVVSNYSGWGHDDKSDFTKRVNEAITHPKTAAPAGDAKNAPSEAAKPSPPLR
jgi:hypothetical protein